MPAAVFESRHTAVVPDVEWIRGLTSGTRHSFHFIVTLNLYRTTAKSATTCNTYQLHFIAEFSRFIGQHFLFRLKYE